MSSTSGPLVVNDSSLVFAYDMGNQYKSWKGGPNTNSYWNNGSPWAPWTARGVNTDITGTSADDGPIRGAKTWKFNKDGTSNQWNGWEGTYGGTWTGSAGDIWTTSYWYKTTSPAGLGSFGIGSFYVSDWSRAYARTILANVNSIIADGQWHYNYTVVRLDEAYTSAIIADGPSWGYSTSAGELYINGLTWSKTSYAPPPYSYTFGARTTTQTVNDLLSATILTPNNISYDYSGESFTFDGTSSWLQSSTPNLASVSGSADSTVIVWCKPDSTGPSNQYTGLVSWGSRVTNTPSTARVLSLYTSGTTMFVSSAFWGNDYTPNSLTVNANQWNMVAMISRGTATTNNVTFYRGNSNGLASQTGSSSSSYKTLNTTNTSLGIGVTDYPGRFFKGQIGAVQIYNRELTATEIANNFNASRGRYGL